MGQGVVQVAGEDFLTALAARGSSGPGPFSLPLFTELPRASVLENLRFFR